MFQKAEVPKDWNCNQSIKKNKEHTLKWKALTQELAQELWIARLKLKRQGKRSDLHNDGILTWEKYCEEIGTSTSVVNRWLKRLWGESETILKNDLPLRVQTFHSSNQYGDLCPICKRSEATATIGHEIYKDFGFWVCRACNIWEGYIRNRYRKEVQGLDDNDLFELNGDQLSRAELLHAQKVFNRKK